MGEPSEPSESQAVTLSVRPGNTQRVGWSFTLKADGVEVSQVIQMLKCMEPRKWRFQLEQGEETGYQHYQGCFLLKKKLRFTAVQKLVLAGTHLEGAKNWLALWNYCGKEESRLDGPWENGFEPIKDWMAGRELYWWQKEILELIKTEPDERTIHWYWEPNGCAGKTSFARHLGITHERVLFVGGTAGDIKCGVKMTEPKPRVVIWNVVRSVADRVSYRALEEVKDAYFFSGKYEPGMVLFNTPHVIVFANCEPDYDKLSSDRWHVVCIE